MGFDIIEINLVLIFFSYKTFEHLLLISSSWLVTRSKSIIILRSSFHKIISAVTGNQKLWILQPNNYHYCRNRSNLELGERYENVFLSQDWKLHTKMLISSHNCTYLFLRYSMCQQALSQEVSKCWYLQCYLYLQ